MKEALDPAVRRLDDYAKDERFPARVVSTERITPDASKDEVREIVLDVDRKDFEYRVGQSVGVLAPGDPALGQDVHFRLYSVADLPGRGAGGAPRIKICVRRCHYVDSYSGERYPGIASNYLCDLAPGDTIEISGPYGLPFEVPAERDATLILIASGTGIAPFRALVKHLYANVKDWGGRVLLFHGASSGLELIYQNDEVNDFAQYYDRDTFEAFRALSPRPHWEDPIGWDYAMAERGEELWGLLEKPDTYVYVAGLENVRDQLDNVFANLAGSEERWKRRKAELAAGRRWVELLY